MSKLRTYTCRSCHGTGLNQQNVAANMRQLLASRSRSQRDVARTLNLSPAYINDLFNGRRDWSVSLMASVIGAILEESEA